MGWLSLTIIVVIWWMMRSNRKSNDRMCKNDFYSNSAQQPALVHDVHHTLITDFNKVARSINNHNAGSQITNRLKRCCGKAKELYDSTVNEGAKICKVCFHQELHLYHNHYLCDWCENIVPALFPASDLNKMFICTRCVHIERALEKPHEIRKTTCFTDIDGSKKTLEELLLNTWGKSGLREKNNRINK